MISPLLKPAKLIVTPEGRPDIWLPTKESLLAFISSKSFEQIHCFLPVSRGMVTLGADWDVPAVIAEIENPDARVAVFTDQNTNMGHSLALTTSKPPELKCFDIGPITLADLEVQA